jgi:gliding motility-associatede transport system auxiliary component
MALSNDKNKSTQPPAVQKAPSAASGKAPAQAWIVPVYLAGLVLLYVGERVIVSVPTLKLIASGLGLSLLLFTTVARFVPKFQAGGQRASIERLLGILSVGGLVAIVIYFASTSWGLGVLGVMDKDVKTREHWETALQIAWVILLLVSVTPMLFAEVALASMRNSPHVELRRVRVAATSGLALSLAVAYCSLFVYAAGQTEAQADFSYFKTSEPGDSTRKMLESFDAPVKITAFFPDVSEVRHEVAGYLTQLTQGVPDVELAVVDRYLEPKLAKDLKVFSDGTIVFAKGDATRTLTVGADLKTARPKLKTLDRDVQEQLYQLVRSRRTAYLTVGHGELNGASAQEKAQGRGSEILETLLRKQNYQVKPLGLSQGLGKDVPDDAEMVFVLGPTEPFAPEEIEALQRYAGRGGHVFLALDSDSVVDEGAGPVAEAKPAAGGTTPVAATGAAVTTPGAAAAPAAATDTPAERGMEALAKAVGLSYSPALLANESHYVQRRANESDKALLITNRFSSHASVSTLSRNQSRAAIIMPRSGSLSALPDGGDIKVDIALRAMTGTFNDLNKNYRFDKDTEKQDSYGLVAAVTRPVKGGEKPPAPEPDKKDKKGEPGPKEMRAFVMADADAISDLILSNFGPNRMLVLDAVRWLGGEESFVGEINDEEDVKIEHSKQKDLAWFYSTIFGAPVLVLGVGLAISRRARRVSARSR